MARGESGDGRLMAGSRVNIERSLRLGDSLGGHLVTGHIDGLGKLDARTDDKDWSFFWFRAAPRLMRQMASKGSITVDGVSLTVNAIPAPGVIQLSLIPFTLVHTTLGERRAGDAVHIEGDTVGKYVRQFTAAHRAASEG